MSLKQPNRTLIHPAWNSERDTLSTAAVTYTINWDPKETRGAIPTRQAPSDNTPIVAKVSYS